MYSTGSPDISLDSIINIFFLLIESGFTYSIEKLILGSLLQLNSSREKNTIYWSYSFS